MVAILSRPQYVNGFLAHTLVHMINEAQPPAHLQWLFIATRDYAQNHRCQKLQFIDTYVTKFSYFTENCLDHELASTEAWTSLIIAKKTLLQC